jgi:hypothetical protein
MKHLKLFESFSKLGLSIEDVKDLLQDTIDEFNLRPLDRLYARSYLPDKSNVDSYQIEYNSSNNNLMGHPMTLDVFIYVNSFTYNSDKFQFYVNEFSSRLRVMGYNVWVFDNYEENRLCFKQIYIKS